MYMDSTIIIVLAIVLLILIVLHNITIVYSSASQASCSQTTFGCCPDGVNSKIDFYGTNCPSYKPAPGYPPQPVPHTIIYPSHQPTPYPPQPQPQPQPEPVPGPGPKPQKMIGGCGGTRYGCCPDNYTPKMDTEGSNCPK